jgi:hypothetical protein
MGAIPAAFGASWQYQRFVPRNTNPLVEFTPDSVMDIGGDPLPSFVALDSGFSVAGDLTVGMFYGVRFVFNSSLPADISLFVASDIGLILNSIYAVDGVPIVRLSDSLGNTIQEYNPELSGNVTFATGSGSAAGWYIDFVFEMGDATAPVDVTGTYSASFTNGGNDESVVDNANQLAFPVNPAIPYFRIVAAALDTSWRVLMQVDFTLGGVRQSTLQAWIGGDSPAPGTFFMNPPSKPLVATYFGDESGCGAFSNASEDLLTNYLFCEWSALCDKVTFTPLRVVATGSGSAGVVVGVLQIASR